MHEKILDDRPLDEAHPLWATSHYGAHKAAVEKFVHSHAASILLRLGMTVAAADGDLDESGQEFITRHLEEQFDLSPQESVRLEHLAHLLSHSPTNDAKLAKKLRELPENERHTVGHFLIGIAAADGIITRDEVMVTGFAWRLVDRRCR